MTIPDNFGIPPHVPAPTPMIQAKDSSLAIVSLITGILGWLLLPFIGALAAIITGHLAKKEIRESGGMITGKGMATAGLILGYVQIGFIVLGIIIITLLVVFSPSLVDWANNLNFQY